MLSIVGAVSSVVDLLKKFGILDPGPDPVMDALNFMKGKVTQFYGYLELTERRNSTKIRFVGESNS